MSERRKSEIIVDLCRLLSGGEVGAATALARAEYPFAPRPTAKRKTSNKKALEIFLRDGFVDRYAGTRLVFTPALRLLSTLLPAEIPYHLNWKMSETHMAFWELAPTIDHLLPVARGGEDQASNMFTTSMLRNQAKASWTLEELQWQLHPPGDMEDWDGLTRWFVDYARDHEEVCEQKYFREWVRLTAAALEAL
jgi:hypothetical protein